mmetsp:Transcript_25498/g.73364  ORF Transcript_25498/g.73364 Transcript_25498/m.73364 type:complete len:206 (+) Transcript_25498:1851-2468(+)
MLLEVSTAKTVLGAMPPKAMAMSSITNPSSPGESLIRIPDVTILMSSSRRRACLNGLTYSNTLATTGTSIFSTISVGSMSTVRYFKKNSETFLALRLTDLSLLSSNRERVNLAPMAANIGFISEIGLAVTKLPPKHATFRICVDANHRSMLRIGPRVRQRGTSAPFIRCSHSCWIRLSGVQAPITTTPTSAFTSNLYSSPMASDG